MQARRQYVSAECQSRILHIMDGRLCLPVLARSSAVCFDRQGFQEVSVRFESVRQHVNFFFFISYRLNFLYKGGRREKNPEKGEGERNKGEDEKEYTMAYWIKVQFLSILPKICQDNTTTTRMTGLKGWKTDRRRGDTRTCVYYTLGRCAHSTQDEQNQTRVGM